MGLAAFFRPGHDDDARKSQRFKVFLPVQISCAETNLNGYFVDVSNAGARLRARITPVVREKVQVEWEGKLLSGTVAWVKKDLFGLTFERPLTNNQLLAMIAG
jgi:hypothetical protein